MDVRGLEMTEVKMELTGAGGARVEGEPKLMGRALPAALQMLCMSRSSCILSVTAEEGAATIAIADGKIAWATAASSQRLGDLLVEKGFVEREVLESVVSMQKRKRTRNPICTILCELGLVSPEVARAEIEGQTTDVVLQVLDWGSGTMRVEPYEPDVSENAISVDQEVETLLVRVALLREGFGPATREATFDGAIIVQ